MGLMSKGSSSCILPGFQELERQNDGKEHSSKEGSRPVERFKKSGVGRSLNGNFKKFSMVVVEGLK